MFTLERIERDPILDQAVEKALKWPIFDHLIGQNVSFLAVYGITRGENIAEIRIATDLEKTDSECDVVIIVDAEETRRYDEEDYIPLMAHLMRSIETTWQRDMPAIKINQDHASKIDLTVVRDFGVNHASYRNFFDVLEKLKIEKTPPHKRGRSPMNEILKYQ